MGIAEPSPQEMRDHQVQTLVFTALGEASMAWDETPTGIFDSTKAREIGDELCKQILEWYHDQDAHIYGLQKITVAAHEWVDAQMAIVNFVQEHKDAGSLDDMNNETFGKLRDHLQKAQSALIKAVG